MWLTSPPRPRNYEPAHADQLEAGLEQMPSVPRARRLIRTAALATVAVVAFLLVDLNGLLGPTTMPLIRIPVEFIASHRLAVALWLFAGVALVAVTGGLVWSRAFVQWRRSRIRAAIASQLRGAPGAGGALRPELLRIRAQWTGRFRMDPARIRCRYPTGRVQQDPTEALTEMFYRDFGIFVSVVWLPRNDSIEIRQVAPPELPEPEPARVEELHDAVARVHSTVDFLLPDVTVDQEQSVIDEDGRPTRLVLRYGQTTKDASPGFRKRLADVLEQKVPSPTGAWSLIWRPETGTIVVSPQEPIPDFVLNEGIPKGWKDRLAMPLGKGRGGRWIVWRPIKFPHILVGGVTGGGKTGLIRTVLVLAVQLGWRVTLLDPKQTSFRYFEDWPGVVKLCITAEDMRQAIFDHREEMQRVYDDIRLGRLKHRDIVPHLLIFDEVTEGLEDIKEYIEENLELLLEEEDRDPKTKLAVEIRRVTNALWRVTRKGRESRIWQLLGLQRPDVRFIPGEARDNLVSRIAAGFMKVAGLTMMFEDTTIVQRVTRKVIDPDTHETVDQAVPGRMTVNVGNGPEPMQCSFTPNPDDASPDELELLERLRHMAADAQLAVTRRGGFVDPAAEDPVAAVEQAEVENGPSTLPFEAVDVSEAGPRVQHQSVDAASTDELNVVKTGAARSTGSAGTGATGNGESTAAESLPDDQWVILSLEEVDTLVRVDSVSWDEDEDEGTVTIDYTSESGESGSCVIDVSELVPLAEPPAGWDDDPDEDPDDDED